MKWHCPDCKKAGRPNALHEDGQSCPLTGRKQVLGTNLMLLRTLDYDPGLLNDFGGGNIEWWQDYIRSEIARCNAYWRTSIEIGPKG